LELAKKEKAALSTQIKSVTMSDQYLGEKGYNESMKLQKQFDK